jgi:DNA-binding MurR/RpiR family transcriptional regulator
MYVPMSLSDRIADAAARFTPAERRVAQAVADDPKIVAFGTVAQLATHSGTSGPTVLRFASKLGFSGFAQLQTAVQEEIADALRPATERIRERPPGDVLSRTLTTDLENVRSTLEGTNPDELRAAVELLADRRRALHVLAGEFSRGVGLLLATQLEMLRDHVSLVGGSPVRVSRLVSTVTADDVVVAIDHRRYERWVLETTRRLVDAGASLIAITDSAVSPLADRARHTFVVSARSPGPFDSHAGTIALVDAIVTGVATRLRRSATERLDAVEAAWSAASDLVD